MSQNSATGKGRSIGIGSKFWGRRAGRSFGKMQAQGATVRCYQYDSVYPGEGKELQLEQVRALLPKYALKKSVQTTVCCYQKDLVYSASGELQLEQIRASLLRYQDSSDCDMEMTEVSRANITVFLPPHTSASNGMDEQLEKLMCVDEAAVNKPAATVMFTECGDGLEQELCRQMEQDSKMTSQQNKENEQCFTAGSGKYAFSPDDVEGVPNWPSR